MVIYTGSLNLPLGTVARKKGLEGNKKRPGSLTKVEFLVFFRNRPCRLAGLGLLVFCWQLSFWCSLAWRCACHTWTLGHALCCSSERRMVAQLLVCETKEANGGFL